jgi:hypothetical protein
MREEQALRTLEAELAEKEADVAQLRLLVQQLRKRVEPQGPARPISDEYERLGITEAARRFLRGSTGPKSTREICDAFRERGLRTRSKKLTASVYATLKNNSKEFERVGDTWTLKEVTEDNTKR